MAVEYVPVLQEETKIIELRVSILALGTVNLGTDIAVTCYNPATKRAGLARTKDFSKLEPFVREIIESDYTNPIPISAVRVIGGTDQDQSWLMELVLMLDRIDAGRDIINLASHDKASPQHDSFKITVIDGRLGPIRYPYRRHV